MPAQAQTIEQLRQARAVVLPLDCGLSMEQAARAIGRSVPWTCRPRNRFLAGGIVGDGQRQSRDGRRRQNMSAEQERELSLPPCAPKLNPVEHFWDGLREKRFHNRVFDSIDALEEHLEIALRDFELDHQRIKPIVAWPRTVDALLN